MSRRDPPAKRYLANLPGIGQGMLDTLQAVYGPITVDTVRTDKNVYAEFQPGRNRLIINPNWVEWIMGKNPESKVHGVPARDIIPLTIAHEVLGHGFGATEEESDLIGRAFVRASGRDPGLMYESGESRSFMRRVLDLLKGEETDGN